MSLPTGSAADGRNPIGFTQNFSRQVSGTAVSIHGSDRSEEHTSELQSLMRISYAVFCLKKKTQSRQKLAKNTRTSTITIQTKQYEGIKATIHCRSDSQT